VNIDRPLSEQERVNFRQRARRETRHPTRSPYYDAWSDVPHNVNYADGQVIWMSAGGGTYDMYVFKRTNDRDPDGGSWQQTGVTSSAAIISW